MNHQRTPNFYCIGAQKAGTTSIHEILKQHKDIYLPDAKEAQFFHDDHLYHKGVDWYLNEHFSTLADEKVVGSVTPNYLYFENSAERIHRIFGENINFLVILRNPAERAFSHYNMSKYRGYETLPFDEAIKVEEKRISGNLQDRSRFSYIDRGYYYKQISRYLEYFPVENFMFLNFETELVKNLDQSIAKLCRFLGIEHRNLNTNVHARTAKEALFPKVNQLLTAKQSFTQKISDVLPADLKKRIRTFIMDINKKSPQQRKLNDGYKRKLISKYYIDDITKLEEEFNFKHQWLD